MDIKTPKTVPVVCEESTPQVQQSEPITQHQQPTPRHRKSKLIPIGNKKYITIRKYGGKPNINIRDYTSDDCGKLYSTKRGIMLSVEEWIQLKDSCSIVDNFLQERQLKEKTLS